MLVMGINKRSPNVRVLTSTRVSLTSSYKSFSEKSNNKTLKVPGVKNRLWDHGVDDLKFIDLPSVNLAWSNLPCYTRKSPQTRGWQITIKALCHFALVKNLQKLTKYQVSDLALYNFYSSNLTSSQVCNAFAGRINSLSGE